MAHFEECDEKLAKLFNDSPEGVIRYFNENVVSKGDLTFSLWEELRLTLNVFTAIGLDGVVAYAPHGHA